MRWPRANLRRSKIWFARCSYRVREGVATGDRNDRDGDGIGLLADGDGAITLGACVLTDPLPLAEALAEADGEVAVGLGV